MANEQFNAGQQVKVVGNAKDELLSFVIGQDFYIHAIPNGQVVSVIEYDGDTDEYKVDVDGITLMHEEANDDYQWVSADWLEAV